MSPQAEDIGFVNGKVIWAARNQEPSVVGVPNQLWVYDPSAGTGQMLASLSPTPVAPEGFPIGFVALNGGTRVSVSCACDVCDQRVQNMFGANDGSAIVNRLWSTDGTTAGTVEVSTSIDAIVPPLVASNGATSAYFQVV
jgi:hypothetical protein